MPEAPQRSAWLLGSGRMGECPASHPSRSVRLVLIGPPGAGKGTLAGTIIHHTGACHLSTGDVFRAAWGAQSNEISHGMRVALETMRRGELVRDETAVEIVRERSTCLRCPQGFVLDGFPRTVVQAQALETLLGQADKKLDRVINLVAADEIVVARVSNRRICRKCKAIWHIVHRPPTQSGICDHCRSELIRRPDDHPQSICTRLREYHETSSPLLAYYRETGLLLEIDANRTAEEVAHSVTNLIPAFAG